MNQQNSAWSLYIIQTERGVLYTGITTDLQRRLTQHSTGRGAKALRGRGALSVVYHSTTYDHSTALKIEYRIKRLHRSQKLALIAQYPLDVMDWLANQ